MLTFLIIDFILKIPFLIHRVSKGKKNNEEVALM